MRGMKSILAMNLAIGCFLLFWAAIAETRTFGLASDLVDELRTGSSTIKSIGYSDVIRLLRRATERDAAVCAAAGGVLVATSSLGLWLRTRRPAPPDPGREAEG